MKQQRPEAKVILVCPCCASPVDAQGDRPGRPQQLSCVACGQDWLMVVDADRQAEFALT